MRESIENGGQSWRDLSDKELEALYLDHAARNFQWRIDDYLNQDDRLTIEGWAITLAGSPEESRFLINGTPFADVQYPIPSPDIGQIFWNIPSAEKARFRCSTAIDRAGAYSDGFAHIEFHDGSGEAHAKRRAWYIPDPTMELPVPEGARVRRVIGVPDPFNYLMGGAAIYKRLEYYLQQNYSRTFGDFGQILDWACGCGRVARYFRWADRAALVGVDIDADNVEWCRTHLPHAQFIQSNLEPPLPFPDRSFDMVLAISVLHQLSATHQEMWLRELKRVAKRDALLLVSVGGLTQIGLARPHPSLLRQIEDQGFAVTGRNPDLDDVMPDQTHYTSGLHSRDYIRRNFGEHFTILDIVDAIAANDDLIVMKNDRDGVTLTDSGPSKEVREPDPVNPFSMILRDYDLNPFIHPMMGSRGYAGHFVDVDGNDYVDFMSAWGTNLLGYGYRKVTRAIIRQAKQFTNLGVPYPQFYELRDLLRKMIPSAEDVRYGKNGSDACAGAVRLVRHLTGREKILYHGYHGFHDWYLASTDCPGIPSGLKGTILPQSDLTPQAVELSFRRDPDRIAGLILNPVTEPLPTADQMHEIIEIVHRYGGLVIFDEMVSGCRVAVGGMQEVWGVNPDLSCFGKAIANGMPLSVLCGRGEYIRRLPEVCYGMTFEGDAVSIAAAFATLTELVKKNVIAALYEKGRRIRTEYNRLAGIYGIATSLKGYEPCMHYEFQDHGDVSGRELLWLMTQELARNGIFTFGAFIFCFSHDRRDLRKLERSLEAAMRVLRQAVDRGSTQGILDERILQCMDRIKAPANWRQATNP